MNDVFHYCDSHAGFSACLLRKELGYGLRQFSSKISCSHVHLKAFEEGSGKVSREFVVSCFDKFGYKYYDDKHFIQEEIKKFNMVYRQILDMKEIAAIDEFKKLGSSDKYKPTPLYLSYKLLEAIVYFEINDLLDHLFENMSEVLLKSDSNYYNLLSLTKGIWYFTNGEYKNAMELLKELIDTKYESGILFQTYARLLLRKGETINAYKYLLRAKDIFADNGLLVLVAKVLVDIAYTYAVSGECDRATEKIKDILIGLDYTRNPRIYNYCFNYYLSTLIRKKDYQSIIDSYKQDYIEGHYNEDANVILAVAYLGLNDFDNLYKIFDDWEDRNVIPVRLNFMEKIKNIHNNVLSVDNYIPLIESIMDDPMDVISVGVVDIFYNYCMSTGNCDLWFTFSKNRSLLKNL